MQKQINVLTHAIERLEAELESGPTATRRAEIAELLQIAKTMRVAIIAKKGVSVAKSNA